MGRESLGRVLHRLCVGVAVVIGSGLWMAGPASAAPPAPGVVTGSGQHWVREVGDFTTTATLSLPVPDAVVPVGFEHEYWVVRVAENWWSDEIASYVALGAPGVFMSVRYASGNVAFNGEGSSANPAFVPAGTYRLYVGVVLPAGDVVPDGDLPAQEPLVAAFEYVPPPPLPSAEAWTAGNVRAVGLALALLVFLAALGTTRAFAVGSKAA